MQRKLLHLHHHHLLLLLLFLLLLFFCLMCEGIGSDSGLLGVRSGPPREGHARVKRHAVEARAKARGKRSWIFPGTLWCGKSSRANTYEDLGMFENADRCCREHDHCVHVIPSFTVNYGVFNSHFYSLSHCDCDQRFRRCLLGVNDTISSMVGYSFFNILRVPCFELKQQRRCTRMHWWGMCKVSKEAPYAVLKPPLPYNASNATSKYGEEDGDGDGSEETSGEKRRATERPAIGSRPKSPKNKHGCTSRDPPRGDTFYRRTRGKGCKKASSQKPKTKSGASMSTTTEATSTVATATATVATATGGGPSSVRATTKQERRKKTPWNADAVRKPRPKTTNARHKDGDTTRRQVDPDLRRKNVGEELTRRTTTAPSDHVEKRLEQSNDTIPDADYQLLCGSLKHLDDCRFQIPPLEKKYGLRNEESKTVFHCDCTTSLAASVRRFKRPSVVPALLAEFVSRRCFKVPKERKCQRRKKRCSGGFGKASDLLRALKKMEEERKDDDDGAAGRQRSGHDARKRAIPVRLYKRCVKLEREAETTKRDYYR